MENQEGQHHATKIEALVEEIEAWEDTALRDKTLELLQSLLQFYGDGLARMMRLIAQHDESMPHLLAQDDMIAHLLLLHGTAPATGGEARSHGPGGRACLCDVSWGACGTREPERRRGTSAAL